MGWKSNSKVYIFFKTNVTFPSFLCPLFLGMRKNVLNFQNVIAIIFCIYYQFFIFECYNLFIYLVAEIIKHTERKKNMI